MPTPDFIRSANCRREILRDLTALAIGRSEGTVGKQAATKRANELMLVYLREVIAAPDLADAFAAAVGLAEPK